MLQHNIFLSHICRFYAMIMWQNIASKVRYTNKLLLCYAKVKSIGECENDSFVLFWRETACLSSTTMLALPTSGPIFCLQKGIGCVICNHIYISALSILEHTNLCFCSNIKNKHQGKDNKKT